MKLKFKAFAIFGLAFLFFSPLTFAKAGHHKLRPVQKFVSKTLPDTIKINDVYVVLFILDGTPRAFLNKLVENGDMPTLKKYFYDGGARFENVVTTFPSASAPAYQAFITGLFAGHSGITYLQWFDRELKQEVDYLGLDFMRVNGDMWNYYAMTDPDVEGIDHPVTIFDKLHGQSSATVYSEISRGAKSTSPILPVAAMWSAFVTGRYEMLDERAMNRVERLFRQPEGLLPRFTLVGLYGSDVSQHAEGTAGENTKFVLQEFDERLARFIDQLKDRNLFDKTYIIVVADHGMHDVHDEVDVAPLLKKAGFKIKHTSLKKEEADIFLSERGVSSAHLYFLNDNAKRRLETIELLRRDPKISFVISRDGNDVVYVYSEKCEAEVRKLNVGGKFFYGYKPFDCDPLGYCSAKKTQSLCSGRLYDDLTWLYATHDAEHPDGVVQFGQLFDDDRAGDIFLTSDDSGFYKTKVATHGSLMKEDISVPVFMTGPTVPKGEFRPIRTVDVHAQILDWFGFPHEVHQDGRRIWGRDEENKSFLDLARLESFLLGRPALLKSANPDNDFTEFKEFVRHEGLSAFVASKQFRETIDAESVRRAGQTKKFSKLLKNLKRSDLAYFVIESELASAEASLRRIDDLRRLAEQTNG